MATPCMTYEVGLKEESEELIVILKPPFLPLPATSSARSLCPYKIGLPSPSPPPSRLIFHKHRRGKKSVDDDPSVSRRGTVGACRRRRQAARMQSSSWALAVLRRTAAGRRRWHSVDWPSPTAVAGWRTGCPPRGDAAPARHPSYQSAAVAVQTTV